MVCPKCQRPFGVHAEEVAAAAAAQAAAAEAEARAAEEAAAAAVAQARAADAAAHRAGIDAMRQAAIHEMLADEAVGVDPAAREELLAAVARNQEFHAGFPRAN